MTTQFELIYSQDGMLKSKNIIKTLSEYIRDELHQRNNIVEITKDFAKEQAFRKILDSDTIASIPLKDKVVGDIMFGILDVYEDLVEDAFMIIQIFNELNCISNKKLIILSFIEILKKDSSLKQKILEEINFLAFENSLEDWQFLKDAIKEINDKFPG